MHRKRALRERWRRYGATIAVLGLGLFATAATYRVVDRNAGELDERRFDEAVASVTAAIQQRMEFYVNSLRSTRAHVVTTEKLTRVSFAQYVAVSGVIERYPGIQGLGLSIYVPKHELAAHLARARAEHGDSYRLWPEGDRAEYSAIVYLEPLDWRNQRAIGFDMFSEPIRREAMERARDSGEPALSSRVVLVQEAGIEQQPGFLVYMPIYRLGERPTTPKQRREALIGWAYAPFRGGDLFHALFPPSAMSSVACEVHDGRPSDATLLGSIGASAELFRTARHTREVPLRIGNRELTLRFASRPELELYSARRYTFWVIVAGTVVAVLASIITFGQARRRRSAEATGRRSAVLADTGRELAASLDPSTTLQVVAERIVASFADGCRFDVGDESFAAGNSGDPPEAGPGYVNSVLVADRARRLEIPLITRGEELGLMTLVRTPSSAAFRENDRGVAREIARACAAALDNARAYRAAREAVAVRDDFLSIASHELKTPVTALRLLLQTTLRHLRAGADPNTLIARIERADKQLGRLVRLVDELLDLSRIMHGKLAIEREELDLGALTRDVVLRHVDQAAAVGSSIAVEAPEVVGQWDRVRLEQVLTNLLSNAIKYGGGQPIQVAVQAEDGSARIAVRDRGVGISEADRARIFGRFERAVSTRQYGGLGLGLFITQQIVEAHGGTIAVESAPGEGATFTVTLPRSDAQADFTSSGPPESSPA